MIDLREKLQQLLDSMGGRRVDLKWLILLAVVGVALVVVPIALEISDQTRRAAIERLESEGHAAAERLTEVSAQLHTLLTDVEVQNLARRALANPETLPDLRQYVDGRIPEVRDVRVFDADLADYDPVAAGANGFALLDMMLMAEAGQNPPQQIHSSLETPLLYDVAVVSDGDEAAGYLAVGVEPAFIASRFESETFSSGYAALTQYNGRQPATVLERVGSLEGGDSLPQRLPVSGTLLRIEQPMMTYVEYLPFSMLLILLLVGALTLTATVFLYRKNKEWAEQRAERERRKGDGPAEDEVLEADPGDIVPAAKPAPADEGDQEGLVAETPDADGEKAAEESSGAAPLEPEAPPMQLRYNVSERIRKKREPLPPVDLRPEIFRAYDIRGIVGKTLDAGIARQVGQVLGTLALEKDAGPVVVARDGRLSGPDLVDGMIEGITASGCDVLDIGAVPTGVLYYAAYERARGTGVMITGSHNPPDYNGFKIMLAGHPLHGAAIRRIHERIVEGEFRVGEGSAEQADVLDDYRERIAGDIKLDRPLRVVIDCGNGIGGICAADVLRAVGAEVLPLFDEVDGTFPNHHPDPSDPENLEDLIESVRLMDADIGLALDGDADRLGVVTLGGSIIYADRIMMLLAMDVLDRMPGATIIYDVKCTGHLAKVIREAGGNPVMYKTGHSLIKARMKEIDSPFAGEMSGHFFFGERWYGVDDGIYAAARLLEILAGAEAPPEAILNALPTSYSTPELKVHLEEGENHAFVEILQSKAKFDGAQVSTIDGVRADWEDGWGLVRASNTTPILVVRFDAETEQALERIKNVFRSKMLAINPDLELPF
ncbi:phosphomannomutase/phosphoglucomutase [Elongatibacter sediminis]|uniref:phosphomannomutase n=1 Tax=Elongatibacter sediminis TaxID=3119006 RepID=A0AAW9RII5_9GAMM